MFKNWGTFRKGKDPASIQISFASHLQYSLSKDQYTATFHDRYLALAFAIRDRLIDQWIKTQQTHHHRNVKRVYYLSLEFLPGRIFTNNITNMGIEREVREALEGLGLSWNNVVNEEGDAGLGNGGLGRLAACFLDSLATLQIPAMGYGLRYDYGIFRQQIENGYQVEGPDDWLRMGYPWEIRRPEYSFPVHFGGKMLLGEDDGPASSSSQYVYTRPIIGLPYDVPVVGFGAKTVNTLRLWSARAYEEFDFEDFNHGDYVAAVESKVTAENITKVLYPNDNLYQGKELRLKQQYFFVSCTLQDILRRFKVENKDLRGLPDKVAIQLNDTHPALAIPSMMRILVDKEGLEFDEAFDITTRLFGYTNHTLLPEALERWPVDLLDRLVPRCLQIIYEINKRFLKKVSDRHPEDWDRIRRMSLVEEEIGRASCRERV